MDKSHNTQFLRVIKVFNTGSLKLVLATGDTFLDDVCLVHTKHKNADIKAWLYIKRDGGNICIFSYESQYFMVDNLVIEKQNIKIPINFNEPRKFKQFKLIPSNTTLSLEQKKGIKICAVNILDYLTSQLDLKHDVKSIEYLTQYINAYKMFINTYTAK